MSDLSHVAREAGTPVLLAASSYLIGRGLGTAIGVVWNASEESSRWARLAADSVVGRALHHFDTPADIAQRAHAAHAIAAERQTWPQAA